MSSAAKPAELGWSGGQVVYECLYCVYASCAQAKDLGHACRECRRPFITLGEPLTERRGARISSRYHAECFSGFADPRSQVQSSHHSGHLAGTQIDAAPAQKATSKMRTATRNSVSLVLVWLSSWPRHCRVLRNLCDLSHCTYLGAGTGSHFASKGLGGKHGAAMGMGSNGFGSKSSKPGKLRTRAVYC
jgi:hypothetical protein